MALFRNAYTKIRVDNMRATGDIKGLARIFLNSPFSDSSYARDVLKKIPNGPLSALREIVQMPNARVHDSDLFVLTESTFGMDFNTFLETFTKWASEFNFHITLDSASMSSGVNYISFQGANVEGLLAAIDQVAFASSLDQQTASWGATEMGGKGKNAKADDGLATSHRKPLNTSEGEALSAIEGIIGRSLPVLTTIDRFPNPAIVGFSASGGTVLALGLTGQNIKELPDAIGNFSGLKTLILDENQLSSLPQSIGKLHSLTYLDLSENHLDALPTSMGNLVLLRDLRLGHNRIASLPDEIGNLKEVTHLDLCRNQLTSLPESLGNLISLRQLVLASNLLSSLPKVLGQLINLVTLIFSGNNLTALPETIGNLRGLTDFRIDGNKLTTLPATLKELQAIQTFYFEGNEELGIPAGLKPWIDDLISRGAIRYQYREEAIKRVKPPSLADPSRLSSKDLANRLQRVSKGGP